jgi:hypothetical protein
LHPQKQSNRAQSGSPKSSENALVCQIVIFAIARRREAKRWRESNGDEDHNSHKDDDDDDLASCLPSAAVAPAPHAFDVSLLLMLRLLLPSGTLFSFLFFFFSFFPSDCCFSGVLFHQGSVQAVGSGLGRLPFGERVSSTPFLFQQFCFDQKSEDIVRTARALFFLISRIFVFLIVSEL